MSYIIIIRGPLGIGKSTISKKLADILNAYYISVDDLLKKEKLDNIDESKGFIPVRNFIKVNNIIFPEIKKKLKQGRIVILDGNFYHKKQIENLIDNFPHHIFTLKATLKACIERDNKRKNSYGKDATTDVYRLVSKFNCGKVIDTNKKTIKEIIKKILSYLPKK